MMLTCAVFATGCALDEFDQKKLDLSDSVVATDVARQEIGGGTGDTCQVTKWRHYPYQDDILDLFICQTTFAILENSSWKPRPLCSNGELEIEVTGIPDNTWLTVDGNEVGGYGEPFTFRIPITSLQYRGMTLGLCGDYSGPPTDVHFRLVRATGVYNLIHTWEPEHLEFSVRIL